MAKYNKFGQVINIADFFRRLNGIRNKSIEAFVLAGFKTIENLKNEVSYEHNIFKKLLTNSKEKKIHLKSLY